MSDQPHALDGYFAAWNQAKLIDRACKTAFSGQDFRLSTDFVFAVCQARHHGLFPCSVNSLALFYSGSNITYEQKKAINLGLLTITVFRRDERQKRVFLTDQGHALLDQIEGQLPGLMAQQTVAWAAA